MVSTIKTGQQRILTAEEKKHLEEEFATLYNVGVREVYVSRNNRGCNGVRIYDANHNCLGSVYGLTAILIHSLFVPGEYDIDQVEAKLLPKVITQ